MLLVLHAGAAGALWANGTAPDAPAPRTANQSADAAALVAAAVHNDGALPFTSDVRTAHAANDTVLTRFELAADPRAGQVRARIHEQGGEISLGADSLYRTGWGQWLRQDGEWRYDGSRDGVYDHDDVRLLQPNLAGAETVDRTGHENGSVTLTLEGGTPTTGLLALAGTNTTLTYRIAFDDGRPYVAFARAVPADGDGTAITVRREPGATVRRPAALPSVAPGELADRLVAGARYA